MPGEPQALQDIAPLAESRTERAAVTLTKSEKESLRLVSLIDETDESTLLRNQTVDQIVARAEEIRGRMGRGR